MQLSPFLSFLSVLGKEKITSQFWGIKNSGAIYIQEIWLMWLKQK